MAAVMIGIVGFVFVTVPAFSPVHEHPTWQGLAVQAAASGPALVARHPELMKQSVDVVKPGPSVADVTETAKVPSKSLGAQKLVQASSDAAKIPAVEEAKQLSAKIESTVRDISKINVPGVSRHSDAQLDQMAEVYFRKLSDKKAHTNVMRIVKSHEATRRSAHAAASARKAAAPKTTLTSLAQQKAHAAEKLKDKALDKEAEKFYKDYTAQKTQLALAKEQVNADDKQARTDSKALKTEPADKAAAKAKTEDSAKQALDKAAKVKAKLAAEEEDKRMDLEAEKLYHQYVEKKADKLRAVRREKLRAQRRAKAKILEQLKAESAPSKAKAGAKAKPAPKPALDDAKLDDEAQKDYQKFIALKQRKVIKQTLAQHPSKDPVVDHAPPKKVPQSATKTEVKADKAAAQLSDKKLDAVAQHDFELMQKLKAHKAQLEAAKEKARLQRLEGHQAHPKPHVQAAKKVDPVASEAAMETKAQALYKQFEAAQRKQALAASQSPPAVSDEEKLEKSMFEKGPVLKKLKPLEPSELHALEVKRKDFEAKVTKSAPQTQTAQSADTDATAPLAALKSPEEMVEEKMGKQPSKPISETELTHLVTIEHTLDAKQRALEPQATPVTHVEEKPLSQSQLAKLEKLEPPAVHVEEAERAAAHAALKAKAHARLRVRAHSSALSASAEAVLAKASALKPLSQSELAELHLPHAKAAETQLSFVSDTEQAQARAAANKAKLVEEARAGLRGGGPMSPRQLSELEQINSAHLQATLRHAPRDVSAHSIIERADAAQLTHGDRYTHGTAKADAVHAVTMQAHHSLGIDRLIGAASKEAVAGTQKLAQVSLAEMPDDFIPKDSPAYGMVMRARMAAQADKMRREQAAIAAGHAKEDYNDKMKRLDEAKMLGSSAAGQQQMLMQTGELLDPANVQFDALSDSDSDSDSDAVDSPQDSYAGNRAIVLGGE